MSSPSPTKMSAEDFLSSRLEELSGAPVTTKEAAAALYQRIKNGEQNINDLSHEAQMALKSFLDENGGTLEIPTPTPINWQEYGLNPNAKDEKEAAQQQIEEQKEISLTQQKNTYTTDKNYHLDSSALFGIGMICITIIIVTALILSHKRKSQTAK